MHYVDEKKIPGRLLLIDFEKAFDSVSWKFIQKTLDFFNFGYSLKRWVSVFYTNIQSSVIQNGHLSDFFDIGRGCRQGDPLSSYIFILCTEILTQKIKNNRNIKGLKIDGTEQLLSLFADDTSILLDGSTESLNETLTELSYFAKISGLNINFDKTQVVWLGSKKYSADSIKTKFKLVWGTTSFKMLGIRFHVDLDKIININYTEKIEALRNLIKFWKRRYLTPIGKIVIIKSLMLPIFNHLFLALPNPEQNTIDTMNKLLFDFLWNGPAKIKKNVVIKDYSEGGLRMVNIACFIQSLKCTWMRRMFLTNGKWISTVEHLFDLGKIVNCGNHYPETLSEKTTNKFWKDVLMSYAKFEKVVSANNPNGLDSPLFYNEKLKIGSQSFFFRSWYDKGIRLISDVYKNDHMMEINELEDIFKLKINHLHYLGVSAVVNKYLKAIGKKSCDNTPHKTICTTGPHIPTHTKLLLKSTSGSKHIYDTLNMNADTPTSKMKWNNLYKITEENWKYFYNNPFKITKDSNVLWFQTQILHNFLPLNKYLKTIGIKDNDLCTFCKDEQETIPHLFVNCRKTRMFLSSLKPILSRTQFNINFNDVSIIFGTKDMKTDLTILYIKLYINKKRNSN